MVHRWGRDVTIREMRAARWDLCIAASSGDGWCKSLWAIVRPTGLKYRVRMGTKLRFRTRSLPAAVAFFNRLGKY